MYSEIVAYTDGSAVVNGVHKGNGGFGVYIPNLFGEKKAFSCGFKNTKTGRMEIMALYYAIKSIPKDCINTSLVVYSDSEYVVKSFSEKRLEKWVKAGWKNSSGDVKNRDLWEKILEEISNKTLFFLELRHIRSHQVEKEKDVDKKNELLKDPHIIGNMVADRLANYKRHKKLLEKDTL